MNSIVTGHLLLRGTAIIRIRTNHSFDCIFAAPWLFPSKKMPCVQRTALFLETWLTIECISEIVASIPTHESCVDLLDARNLLDTEMGPRWEPCVAETWWTTYRPGGTMRLLWDHETTRLRGLPSLHLRLLRDYYETMRLLGNKRLPLYDFP